MARLKQIFADLNGDADVVKQKYFAKKIVENFLLKEGKATVFKVYSIDYIEDQIFFEAIHKKSLNESIRFVEGIEKQINEGFFSAIKDLGKKAWTGVKKVVSKVKDAVKNWWSGPVVGAVKTWNTAVKTAAKTHLGMLVDSQQYSETSYLFETPLDNLNSLNDEEEEARASNMAAPATTDPAAEKDAEEPVGGKLLKILKLLYVGDDGTVKQTNLVGKQFATFTHYKGSKGSLTFGSEKAFADNDTSEMTTLTWDGSKYFEVIVPAKSSVLIFSGIVDLIHAATKIDKFKLNNVIGDMEVSATDIKLHAQTGEEYVIKGGKTLTMSGGNSPHIKVKTTSADVAPSADGSATAADAADTTPTADGVKPEEKTGGFATPAAGVAPTDAATAPIDSSKSGVGEPTPEEKSEYNKIIDAAVAEAKAKGLPETFYEGMNTTPEAVWGTFDKFAGNGANDYNPVMILVNSTEHAPAEMPELEYLSYLAAMPTFVNSLIKQPVPSQYAHQEGQYKSFLTAVQGATVSLAKVVNGNMTANAKPDAPAASASASASTSTDRVEPTSAPAQPVVKDELVDEDTFNKMKL